MARFKPKTEASLVDVVQAALADRTPLELIGNGTKAALGRPMQTAATLDLSNFSAVSLYEPEELVITAGAGTRLDEVRKLLDDKGQEFAGPNVERDILQRGEAVRRTASLAADNKLLADLLKADLDRAHRASAVLPGR